MIRRRKRKPRPENLLLKAIRRYLEASPKERPEAWAAFEQARQNYIDEQVNDAENILKKRNR